MRTLVTIFLEYEAGRSDQESAKRILSEIGKAFPDSLEAKPLKHAVLNETAPVGTPAPLPTSSLLRALVVSPHYDSFSQAESFVKEAGSALVRQDREAGLDVVESIADYAHPGATALLSVVVSELDVQILRKWARSDIDSVIRLVKSLPALLHDERVWQALPADQLWSLAQSQRGSRQRSALIRAMLAGNADVDPRNVLDRWPNGGDLLLGVLPDVPLERDAIAPWVAAVPPKKLASWLRNPNGVDDVVLLAALEILPTGSIASLPLRSVLALLDRTRSAPETTILLAAALSHTSAPGWAEVAITALDDIAPLAKRNALGQFRDRLDGIETDLPDWDVLARVGRALNRAFKKGRWQATILLHLTDQDAFRAVIDGDQRGGLARTLFVLAAEDSVEVDPWQNKCLATVIAEKADRRTLQKTLEAVGRAATAVKKLIS